MGKQLTAVLAVGLLSIEAIGEVDEHGLYRVPASPGTKVDGC